MSAKTKLEQEIFLYPLKGGRQGAIWSAWPLGPLRGLQGGWLEALRDQLGGHLGQDGGKPKLRQCQRAKTEEGGFGDYLGNGSKDSGSTGCGKEGGDRSRRFYEAGDADLGSEQGGEEVSLGTTCVCSAHRGSDSCLSRCDTQENYLDWGGQVGLS